MTLGLFLLQHQENINLLKFRFCRTGFGAAISTKNYINSGLYVAPRVGYQMKNTELYLGFQNISSRYKDHGPYWHDDRLILERSILE
jgi:hypothetical protein